MDGDFILTRFFGPLHEMVVVFLFSSMKNVFVFIYSGLPIWQQKRKTTFLHKLRQFLMFTHMGPF